MTLALLALTLALGSSVGTSNALAGCWSDSCTGRNPAVEGCAGKTLQEFSGGSYTIRLRYAANCNAAWVQLDGRSDSTWGGVIHGYTNTSTWQPTHSYYQAPAVPGGTYSLMVSYRYYVAACQTHNVWGWETQRCTSRF